MRKINKLALTKVFYILFIVLFASIFIFLSFGVSEKDFGKNANANNFSVGDDVVSTLGGGINVDIYSRDNEKIILENPIDYYDGSAYVQKWSDAEKFVISYIPDEENPPPFRPASDTTPDIAIYTMNITVEFVPAYLDANDFYVEETVTLQNIETQVSYDYTTFDSYELDIDNGISGLDNGVQKEIKEWGIYKFTIDINDAEISSFYYCIEPTMAIVNTPKIEYRTIPSDNSLHDSFEFYLENYEEYRYIDKSRLVWYVMGEGTDGIKYALVDDDLSREDFSECSEGLYSALDYARTGLTFIFNDNEVSGDWTVWCEYTAHGESEASGSNRVAVSTGSAFDYMIVIYIVAGVAAFAILVVVTIAIIRSKKDKVW